MQPIAKILSAIGLGASIIPCFLLAAGMIDHDTVKWLALIGTCIWFIATPMWMGRKKTTSQPLFENEIRG